MAWADEHPAYRAAAERTCTPKQLEALKLYSAGYGAPRISRILHITPQAVYARLHGAQRRIDHELEGAA